MTEATHTAVFPVRDYDLAATLGSGQAFRWEGREDGWHGVVGSRPVRLLAEGGCLKAFSHTPQIEWGWLTEYLQTGLNLGAVLATFPADGPLGRAVAACRGLRLLRQEPWECLASFILSSTKQIVQIRQIVALLCERFGDSLAVARGSSPVYSFPSAARLAGVSEADLRACKMGFRAPYLRETAAAAASGQVDLQALFGRSLEGARAELVRLPGVGPKIADCALLFAYGFPAAFPVDVWILKALQELYFPKRRMSAARLRRFSETHFGPNAGYAQQYLFHYMRTQIR